MNLSLILFVCLFVCVFVLFFKNLLQSEINMRKKNNHHLISFNFVHKEANLCSTKIYYEKPDTNKSKQFE